MTQDNITFNSVKNEGTDIITIGYPLYRLGVNGVDPEFGGIINAVDIDWNEAQLKKLNSAGTGTTNISVTTTGELLSILDKLPDVFIATKSGTKANAVVLQANSANIATLQEAVNTLANTVLTARHYLYIGPIQPTSTNGAQQVLFYNNSYQYTNNEGKTARAYILIHESKSVESVIDNSTGWEITVTDISNEANIPNYKVYKTAGLTPGAIVTINIQ